MGNCLERSRLGHGGEHWSKNRAVWAEEKVTAAAEAEEETRKGESTPATDQVKIRITRRQLEELLRRVEDGNQAGTPPAWEVIAELTRDAGSSIVGRRGPQGQWRPSLQSIPE